MLTGRMKQPVQRKQMDNKLILSASDKLELLDITLHDCNLTRGADIDPLNVPIEFLQQSHQSFMVEEVEYRGKEGDFQILRAYISLGVRTTSINEENEGDKEIYFTIEGTFRADYLMNGSLNEKEIQEFCKHNVVHNVWPFWRSHVFQLTRLSALPQLSIPLLKPKTPNATKKAAKRKRKSTKKATA